MLVNSLLKYKTETHSTYLDDDIIDLSSKNFFIPSAITYKLVKVDKDKIARPDLISKDMYGTTEYGDIICKLNNIPNPFELNEGDILIVPDLTSLENFFTTDNYNNDTNNNTSYEKLKTKKDKRRPNESIIGDTRFKIDLTNRVVIY